MLSHRTTRLQAVPVPAGLSGAQVAEREATRRRLEAKWAALDGLVADFRRTERQLRRRR